MEIVELLDRLQHAAALGQINSIRTIALQLESVAKTPEEKDAVRCLKQAIPDGDLRVIASHVRTVFLRGTVGLDGWALK